MRTRSLPQNPEQTSRMHRMNRQKIGVVKREQQGVVVYVRQLLV
jgi:hypothetical protein